MRLFSVAMVAACPFPANHGTPGLIRETAQALAARGHEIHVVTYPMGQPLDTQGLKVHRTVPLFASRKITVGPTYYKPILDLALAFKLQEVVRKHRISIIHAHNYEGALAGYVAKKITRRPLLYHAVNTMSDELPSYGFLRPRFLAVGLARALDAAVPRMADHVIAISTELREFLLHRGLNPQTVSFIPAGVDPGMFENKDPNQMRFRYRIGDRPLVVYTGTLDRFQRIDLLLRAMRRVLEQVSDAVLLLASNIVKDWDQRALEDLASQLGIRSNVIFSGERPLEEMPYFIAAADVVVLPRPSCPGFPVKLLNYMAASKPIVCYAGSAKGLRDQAEALVVQDNDWEGFGRAILRLLQDRRLAADLGAQARQAMGLRFDWSVLAQQIEEVYEAVLDSRKGRHPR